MPEKPSAPAFDRCNKCSTTRADGPDVHRPSPPTHAEICCLFRLAHPGQSDAFLHEESQKRRDCGRCKDCPGLKVQKQEARPASEPPETSSHPPQQGILGLAAGCEGEPVSQARKRKKIEPRQRQGFKKLTLEIRPPKFKKKLWFGTYTAEEIDRARDAVNFYMGCNQPYTHPDSPLIFASKPLKGIKFEDLQPSCDDFVQVDDGQKELKYKYFARQVKDVIHSVTGKQKKSNSSAPKRNKCKGPPSPSHKLGTCDPSMPSGAASSGTQEHQLAWDPLAMHPSSLPPTEMLTSDEEMQISELLRSNNGREEVYSLAEMFAFHPVVSPFGYGEGSTIEEEDFPSELWNF